MVKLRRLHTGGCLRCHWNSQHSLRMDPICGMDWGVERRSMAVLLGSIGIKEQNMEDTI